MGKNARTCLNYRFFYGKLVKSDYHSAQGLYVVAETAKMQAFSREGILTPLFRSAQKQAPQAQYLSQRYFFAGLAVAKQTIQKGVLSWKKRFLIRSILKNRKCRDSGTMCGRI